MLPVNNGIYAEYSFNSYDPTTGIWKNEVESDSTMECIGAILKETDYLEFSATDTSYAKFTHGPTPDVEDTSSVYTVYAILKAADNYDNLSTRPFLYNSPDGTDATSIKIGVERGKRLQIQVNDSDLEPGWKDDNTFHVYYCGIDDSFKVVTLVANTGSGEVGIYVNGTKAVSFWDTKLTCTKFSTSTYIADALSGYIAYPVRIKYLAFGSQVHYDSEIQQNYQYLYNTYICRWNYLNGQLTPIYSPDISGYSMKKPYPKSVWRMDPWWNDGVPYTMLMPNVKHVTPPDPGYDSIEFLDKVRVISTPHGLDRLFPVTKMRIPLDKPSETKYTVGTTVPDSFTASSAAANGALSKKVSEIPPPSSILKMAADNASKIINNATTGYVTLHKNGDMIDEIIISDEEDYTKAQRIWRWNSGGLGYSSTGYNGTYGTAITMDGSIVADRVTTGTMHADRIRGGELVLGGYDNVNGIFKLVDENGKVMITMTREGIDMKSADRDGFFLNLRDGQLYGGKGDTVWGRLSPTIQTETDDPDRPMHGLWIDGACINITPTKLNIGDHDNPLTVWSTFTGDIDVVTGVDFASESVTKTTLHFKHGILLG